MDSQIRPFRWFKHVSGECHRMLGTEKISAAEADKSYSPMTVEEVEEWLCTTFGPLKTFE